MRAEPEAEPAVGPGAELAPAPAAGLIAGPELLGFELQRLVRLELQCR